MDYNLIWKIFALGLAILIGAIIINAIATITGLTTWYAFINNIRQTGLLKAIVNEKIISLIFLFLIYPLLLGTIGYYMTKLLT
jgi:hypothetical protein